MSQGLLSLRQNKTDKIAQPTETFFFWGKKVSAQILTQKFHLNHCIHPPPAPRDNTNYSFHFFFFFWLRRFHNDLNLPEVQRCWFFPLSQKACPHLPAVSTHLPAPTPAATVCIPFLLPRQPPGPANNSRLSCTLGKRCKALLPSISKDSKPGRQASIISFLV